MPHVIAIPIVIIIGVCVACLISFIIETREKCSIVSVLIILLMIAGYFGFIVVFANCNLKSRNTPQTEKVVIEKPLVIPKQKEDMTKL